MRNTRALRRITTLVLATVIALPTVSAQGTTTWGSIAFNGSQYLSSTNMSAPGTGNFTYEFWFYNTATSSSNQVMMNTRQSVTQGQEQDGIDIVVDPGRGLFVSYKMLAFADTADNTIELNRWYHVAVVRNGNTIYTYLDGTKVGETAMQSTNLYSQKMWIASTVDGTFKFTGNISNLRYTKAAVYLCNFTPATDEFAAIANTSILLKTRSDAPVVTNSVTGTTFNNSGSAAFATLNPFDARQNLQASNSCQSESADKAAADKAAAERAAAVKTARDKLNAYLLAGLPITEQDLRDADSPINSVESLKALYQDLLTTQKNLKSKLSAEELAQLKFTTTMKYALYERITGKSSGSVFGRELTKYGVVAKDAPKIQLTSYQLMKLPLASRDSVDKINQFFIEVRKKHEERKARLAAVIARGQSR